LLGDAHGANFGGEGGANAPREEDGGEDGGEFPQEGEGEDSADDGSGSKVEEFPCDLDGEDGSDEEGGDHGDQEGLGAYGGHLFEGVAPVDAALEEVDEDLSAEEEG